MAETTANIILQTSGGDAAAAEINKASAALNNVTLSSSGMQARFQERFQHIGLMLFAGDALRASGLGAETRMVVNSLNLALTEGAAAAGISSGGIMLVVVALTALAGIVLKVINHHKDLLDSLNKIHDATEKAIGVSDSEIDALTRLWTATGSLSTAQTNLLFSEVKLRQAQIDSLETTNISSIAALNAAIVKDQETIATDRHILAATAERAAIEAQYHVKLSNAGVTKDLSAATTQLATDENALNKIIAQQIDLHKGVTSSIEDQIKKDEEARKKGEQNVKEAFDLAADYLDRWNFQEKNTTELIKKYNTELYHEIEKDQKEQAKQHGALLQGMAQDVKQLTDQMAGDFGKAFAKMIVEGKNFAQEMQAAFQNLEEQIIEMIVKMIAQWMMFEAITGMGGGAFASKMFPAFGGFHATGGSAFADTPTLAMFGEAGPELATFTPMSGGGGQGGGPGAQTQINNITVHVEGVIDSRMVSQIGQEIVKSIRGQGQINFVGS
jgi:hypothetical protein